MAGNKETHYRNLENMYLQAPINKWYQPVININEGECQIKMNIEEKYFHAAKAVHGSIYFKMVDDAAFFAVNSLIQDVFVLTASFQIYLLKPVFNGQLMSKGTVTFQSKNLFIGESTLFNQDKAVAKGSGTFVRSQIPLKKVAGYQSG